VRTAVSCLTISLTSLQFSLVSVEQEIAIGRQAQTEVRKQVPELGADVRAYVGGIGRELVRHADGPKYPYTFSVANYREINAFALPGGPVWINRGAIDAARNESQLAGVLAHEVAHIAQRHAADQLTKTVLANFGLGLLGALLGNSGGANATQVAARLAAGGAFLKFSRDDEREADRVGAELMHRAGWDARGMLEFMQGLESQARRNPNAVEAFFSTHPSPENRVGLLREITPRLQGGRRDSGDFRVVKARLRRLPPAKPMTRPQG
jgi:predicted Zn-dependent protease